MKLEGVPSIVRPEENGDESSTRGLRLDYNGNIKAFSVELLTLSDVGQSKKFLVKVDARTA
jgi:hypothetical protein